MAGPDENPVLYLPWQSLAPPVAMVGLDRIEAGIGRAVDGRGQSSESRPELAALLRLHLELGS